MGGNHYLGVKDKWVLIEAPVTGICGFHCRAVIADVPNLLDPQSWNDVFMWNGNNFDPDPLTLTLTLTLILTLTLTLTLL